MELSTEVVLCGGAPPASSASVTEALSTSSLVGETLEVRLATAPRQAARGVELVLVLLGPHLELRGSLKSTVSMQFGRSWHRPDLYSWHQPRMLALARPHAHFIPARSWVRSSRPEVREGGLNSCRRLAPGTY